MTQSEEILALLRENNLLLKEAVSILRKINDPDYVMEQDINDFVMNIVANMVASDLEKRNSRIVNMIKTKLKNG